MSRLPLVPGSYPSADERWSRLLAIVQRDAMTAFLPLLGISLQEGMELRRIGREFPRLNAGDLSADSGQGPNWEQLGQRFRDELSRRLGADLTSNLVDLVSKGMPDFPDMRSASLWETEIFPIIDQHPERLPTNLNIESVRSAVRDYLNLRMPAFLGNEDLLPSQGRTANDPRYDDYVALSNLQRIYQWQLHRDFWRKMRESLSEADIRSFVDWAGAQGDRYASTLREPPN